MIYSYISFAISGFPASIKLGLFPLLQSAYNVNCDISRVIDIIRKNADNQNYSSGDIQKFLLYIDVPKYIKEYQRFGFDGTMMISLLKMLHHYEGNWIMTWSTFLQKGLNDENPTLYDMLYTQQEMQSDIYIAHGNYERFEEKVPVKVIYNMFDMTKTRIYLFSFTGIRIKTSSRISFLLLI